MSGDRQVVITGVGVVSPIGVGYDAYRASLEQGQSGIAPYEQFDGSHMPVTFGGEVNDYEAKQFVKPRKSLKVMCKEVRMGVGSASMAMAQAGLEKGAGNRDRFGVVFGSEMHYGDTEDTIDVCSECNDNGKFVMERWGHSAMNKIFPLWMLEYLPNMSACHMAIAHEAYGPNNSIGSGDASGLIALAEAANTITRGHTDVMLAGGTGSRTNMTTLLFRGFSNLSHRNAEPAAACRPFELHRDGMVNGEGAATVIMESSEHASERGARVLAEVAGYGEAFAPGFPEGMDFTTAIKSSMEQALSKANLSAEDVGHVNAHGISLVDHDQQEAAAIAAILGDVPVTAPKSYFGNLGAGSGAVELLTSLVAMETGMIPATLNYQQPDPECPVNVVATPTPSDKPAALLLNQSATGQVAALALRRPA